ncbi:MAG: hypothetical protein LBC89_06220 [Bacteroidales bacterium]|nr:hypothetical protein [Bacteroidales bacterium]
MNNFLNKILQWLSSKVSIWIYVLLFVYLVIFTVVTLLLPALHHLAPSENAQLVLGNYTKVLSVLSASVVAVTGTALHKKNEIPK